MKKIMFICIVILLAAIQTNAQKLDKTVNTKKTDANYLLKKSDSQKTGAFILLGLGAGLMVIGNNIATNGRSDDIISGLGVIISGGALVIASIPIFISSGKNKRRANRMHKDETIFFNPELNTKKNLISIGLIINL